jgi:hypothetical protein
VFKPSIRERDELVPTSSTERLAIHLRAFITSAFAEQGARANDHGRHAACSRTSIEMKRQTLNRDAARGAPATVVAHL